MEPVINPWYIYFIHLLAIMRNIFGMLFMISFAIAFIFSFSLCMETKNTSRYKKILKYSIIAAIVSGIGYTIIPQRDIMITMLAFSYITPENVQLVQGNVADFITQIMQAVKE